MSDVYIYICISYGFKYKKISSPSCLELTTQSFSVPGSEKAQMYTLRTAKALAMTAADVLLDPALLKQVKDEFIMAKQTQE